jgi:hypothetical protein
MGDVTKMGKERKILTHASKGITYGDISNSSVRNILTELSKSLYGGITEQEMRDTVEIDFGWECPYTGRNLKKSFEDADGSYDTDHIYPQNREWCGLNVKGNLVLVDKKANNKKKGMDIDTFMLTDSDFWTELGIDKAERIARLEKIKKFQSKCGYDPEKIRAVVSPILKHRYDEIRSEQEKYIRDTLDALSCVGINTTMKNPIVTTKLASGSLSDTTITTTHKKRSLPELVFCPAGEEQFKSELLKSKKARIVLTYDSGHVKETAWNAESFDITSNLRRNIQSRPFWRNKNKEGLVKVEVIVD